MMTRHFMKKSSLIDSPREREFLDLYNRGKTAPGDVPLYADEASGKVYEAMPCIRHLWLMSWLHEKLPGGLQVWLDDIHNEKSAGIPCIQYDLLLLDYCIHTAFDL